MPIRSIPPEEDIDNDSLSPVMFEEFTMPFTLIGISIFESNIELMTMPLLAANNSLTKISVFFPDKDTFELSNSNSIFVLEFVASDLVWLISGALLIINSSLEPSSRRMVSSSPKMSYLISEKNGGPE